MYGLSPSNIQVDHELYYWHHVNDLYIKDLSNVPMYYAAGILQKKTLLEKPASLFLNVKDPQHFQSYYNF